MNVPSTSPPKGASRASLVYAGKKEGSILFEHTSYVPVLISECKTEDKAVTNTNNYQYQARQALGMQRQLLDMQNTVSYQFFIKKNV
jgi:hypothetical protein